MADETTVRATLAKITDAANAERAAEQSAPATTPGPDWDALQAAADAALAAVTAGDTTAPGATTPPAPAPAEAPAPPAQPDSGGH